MHYDEGYEEEVRPEGTGVKRFFQIIAEDCDGMLKVNILFLLTCIPVVTIPPALYALHRICRRMVTGGTVRVWSQYWEVFRKEWKQAYITFFISLLPMAVIGYGAWFYLSRVTVNVLFYAPFTLCAAVFLTLLLGSGYLYGLLADGRGLSRETVTLALRLGLAKPLRSVLAAAGWYGLVGLGIMWFPYSGAYLFVIGFSLPCLFWEFFIRTTLEKFA